MSRIVAVMARGRHVAARASRAFRRPTGRGRFTRRRIAGLTRIRVYGLWHCYCWNASTTRVQGLRRHELLRSRRWAAGNRRRWRITAGDPNSFNLDTALDGAYAKRNITVSSTSTLLLHWRSSAFLGLLCSHFDKLAQPPSLVGESAYAYDHRDDLDVVVSTMCRQEGMSTHYSTSQDLMSSSAGALSHVG
jgi:hypothetical protein